jgi:hypothetical protein
MSSLHDDDGRIHSRQVADEVEAYQFRKHRLLRVRELAT